MSEQTEQPALSPADVARDHLATIRKGWRHVLNPIETTRGGASQGGPRPATEDELDLPVDARLDTPRTLAFWVHAAIDEWPVTMQTLQPGPDGKLQLVTTESVDCGDVYAMVDYLDREAERLATWVEDGHQYGRTFVAELEALARAVKRVAWPPKGDRMVIGECPACGRRIRVKAPAWTRTPLPQPTTDPEAYPRWVWTDWHPVVERPITCRCGVSRTLTEWRDKLAGPSLLLTAEQIVADVREQLGMRYSPLTVRTWARRGLIVKQGESRQGHALYDRTQVLAALMAREKDRERTA